MFKALVSPGAITQDTNISLQVVKNTNGDISYDSTNKVVVFNNPGHYVIQYHLVATNIVAGNITVAETLNGTVSTTILSSETSAATTDELTFDIPDILSIIPSMVRNTANLSFQSNVACTATTGSLTIFKIGR